MMYIQIIFQKKILVFCFLFFANKLYTGAQVAQKKLKGFFFFKSQDNLHQKILTRSSAQQIIKQKRGELCYESLWVPMKEKRNKTIKIK